MGRMKEKRGQEGQVEEVGDLEEAVLWPGAQQRAGEEERGMWNQLRRGTGAVRGSAEG